eukprot:983341-Prorocentrum_minimum.AAC.1
MARSFVDPFGTGQNQRMIEAIVHRIACALNSVYIAKETQNVVVQGASKGRESETLVRVLGSRNLGSAPLHSHTAHPPGASCEAKHFFRIRVSGLASWLTHTNVVLLLTIFNNKGQFVKGI